MSWNKEINMLNTGIVLVALFLGILMSFSFYLYVVKKEKIKVIRAPDVYKEVLLRTGNVIKNQKIWRYEERKAFLSQTGVNYLMGREVMPEEFFIISVLLGSVLMAIGFFKFGLPGTILFFPGYYLLKIGFILSNMSDNKKMIYDIKGIFDTLAVKTESGMFLISAIVECFRNTRNKRLKTALYEMSGELILKKDADNAIRDFNMKFKNRDIDKLCIMLKQSFESGSAAEILKEMSEQLDDMQQAINVRIKEKLERKVTLVELLVFVSIIITCLYGLMMALPDFMTII